MAQTQSHHSPTPHQHLPSHKTTPAPTHLTDPFYGDSSSTSASTREPSEPLLSLLQQAVPPSTTVTTQGSRHKPPKAADADHQAARYNLDPRRQPTAGFSPPSYPNQCSFPSPGQAVRSSATLSALSLVPIESTYPLAPFWSHPTRIPYPLSQKQHKAPDGQLGAQGLTYNFHLSNSTRGAPPTYPGPPNHPPGLSDVPAQLDNRRSAANTTQPQSRCHHHPTTTT